jgi:type VI secretion system protein ImpE
MMGPAELIKAGRLEEARGILTDEIKAKPADTARRTLLFQVLALCGEWDRAFKHLDMISTLDTERAVAVSAYKDILRAQNERREVCLFSRLPSFLTDAPPYFENYWEACKTLAEGEQNMAGKLFDKAAGMRPGLSGRLGDKEFRGIKDTDSVLAFFIEAFVHDRYVWIPFETVREMIITKPKSLLELIWIPASITTWEGLTANCNLPVLYPGSEFSKKPEIRLGRMTDWEDLGGNFAKALGQHVMQIGENDVSLLEIAEISFNFPVKE